MTTSTEPEVSYGPVPIQTAQDAATAFLQGKISEDKFREICTSFGVQPGQLMQTTGERLDAAFENSLPDDILLPPPAVKDDLEARQKAVEEKEAARADARKEAGVEEEKPVPEKPAPKPAAETTKSS